MTTTHTAGAIGLTMNGQTGVSTQTITPEVATEWLEAMVYKHQRAIRQTHVEFLAEEMRRGNFVQGTQIRVVLYRDRQYLVDGQHRLWAIVLSGAAQVFSVLRTYARSEEEIAWMYGNIDVGLRRTGSDLFGALELDEEFQLSKTNISSLNAAINFMSSGCVRNGAPMLHRDDAVRCMRIYAPYMREYIELAASCDERRIRKPATRAATLSIALLTFRFAAPRAESRGDPSVPEFWRGVIFDDGIQIGDPRKVANRHLLSAGMAGGASADYKPFSVSPAYSSRFIGNCFNAHMERRQLKMTKVFDVRAPLDLYGVPRDPSQWLA